MQRLLQILFEDNHLIIINKRPGDIVQGDKTGDKPLLDIVKDYIKEKFNKPGEVFIGSPHRIDRPTSGIVIFCRNSRSLERMSEMFREKTIHKTYWAIVKNQPPKNEDTLIHYLKKNSVMNKSFTYEKKIPDSFYAELDYKVKAKSDTYFLIEVRLHTGRHHQIRAQLSAIGCPIKGDMKYGFDRPNDDASIHLHSRKVEFIHPSKKEPITVIAPVPDDKLWKYFEAESGKNQDYASVF
jgi:23S rRNA pseudouridine1911/1915/1917 synthase